MKTKITINQLIMRYTILYYSYRIRQTLNVLRKENAEHDPDVEDGWITAKELIDNESQEQTENGRKAEWYWQQLKEILDDDDDTLHKVHNNTLTAQAYIRASRRNEDHDHNHWAPLVTIWDGDECIDAGLREELAEGARAAGYQISTIC